MATLIYQLILSCYRIAIRIASGWNPKAQKWWNGRKNIWQKLQQDLKQNTAPVVWVHCASLGEFEQARPLLERLKKDAPTNKILLTFFSPSGYEYCQNYTQVDWVYYLPLDSVNNARKWIEIVQPKQVFFIKYEYWYFYLNELQKNGIATYLVAAIFRPQQVFFKFYGYFFRAMLECFSVLFVQDEVSKALLEKIGITKVKVVGDTRLDRVIQIQKQASNIPIVSVFSASKPTLVAGSTWAEDEHLLADWLAQNSTYKLVIAPHEIDESHIQAVAKKFATFYPMRYSRLTKEESELDTKSRVLIIDNMGMLNQLYQYGQAAYIGGGFGAGIHNCLEAAVYQVPVFFGSNYHKFREAKELIKKGVAHEIETATALTAKIKEITTPIRYVAIQQAAANYFGEHAGATDKIVSLLDD